MRGMLLEGDDGKFRNAARRQAREFEWCSNSSNENAKGEAADNADNNANNNDQQP